MKRLHILDGVVSELAEGEAVPTEGVVWFDIVRDRLAEELPSALEQTAIQLHEQHQKDLHNALHPSFFDEQANYDMLIFRGLSPMAEGGDGFTVRSSALLMTDRFLLTVREPGGASVSIVQQRLLSGRGRIPRRPVGIMLQILITIVDRFLARRDGLVNQLECWRNDLIDPNHPFDDWRVVLDSSSQLRQLEMLCEDQTDAINSWSEQTDVELDDHLQVRVNDLLEHVRRVSQFATAQRSEIDALVNLHFAAVAHRTNEIMRVLTVISAIFLPLGLVAGIFGMNFEYMPELKYHYAYFVALGGMVLLAVGLLSLFYRRRWV